MLSENIYGFCFRFLVIWYSLVQYNIVRGILLIYFIDATDVKSKCPEMFIHPLSSLDFYFYLHPFTLRLCYTIPVHRFAYIE